MRFFSYHPCRMLKSEKSETPDKAKHLSLHKCNKATKASGTLKFSDIFVGINLKKRERNLELVLYDLFVSFVSSACD